MDVVILHGIASSPGAHWQAWLATELSDRGHDVRMPLLPQADRPDRSTWLETLRSEVEGIDPVNLVVVGHSLGVTTALDFLEGLDDRIHTLVSVAGFGCDYGSDLNSYFLKSRTIDFGKVRRNTSASHVLYGDDDPWVSQSALRQLANDLEVEPLVIPGGGHLNTDAGFSTFPVLLDKLPD